MVFNMFCRAKMKDDIVPAKNFYWPTKWVKEKIRAWHALASVYLLSNTEYSVCSLYAWKRDDFLWTHSSNHPFHGGREMFNGFINWRDSTYHQNQQRNGWKRKGIWTSVQCSTMLFIAVTQPKLFIAVIQPAHPLTGAGVKWMTLLKTIQTATILLNYL